MGSALHPHQLTTYLAKWVDRPRVSRDTFACMVAAQVVLIHKQECSHFLAEDWETLVDQAYACYQAGIDPLYLIELACRALSMACVAMQACEDSRVTASTLEAVLDSIDGNDCDSSDPADWWKKT